MKQVVFRKNTYCSFIYSWMKCGDLLAGGTFVLVTEISMVWEPAKFPVETMFYGKV